MPILIRPDELAARIAAGTAPRILDVRWSLTASRAGAGAPVGRDAYLAGHLPGAVFVDLERELAGSGPAGEGRHPLPGEADFTAAMRRWGLADGDEIVVMDDLGNQSAARAWWLLRHAGQERVRMLDGGLAAWRDAGHPLETGDVAPAPGTATAQFGAMPVIALDEVAAAAADGLLLDARAGERYRGETEPVDPVAGHIPGAVSAPTAANLDETGRFLPAEVLRERFERLGVRADAGIAAYCGSGVTAAHEIAALAIAGFDAALFPGSWSAWSNHPELPVATGPDPGAA
ncbi:sulfurtransferase [Agromyces archimandritae]|uniref:Sulfurtransferase n=1 Tax=Agromyces archimandritae TaxID=2781962 RepID=A0A975FPG8_9MICO|nr:sulfurtransferase [Agromyces archimandritae]QTX05711.1 sulfurtransferase [Agromyces archimandritae]